MRFVKIGCAVALVLAILPFLVVSIAALFNGKIGCETDFSKSQILVSPPPPLAVPLELKIITYNIQDLWVVGQKRPERMRALGKKLTELDPDIVGFQEAFIDDERQILIDALKDSRLQFHQYYKSGTVGSGLMISSAFPIAESYFHRYTVSNPWFKVWEGDWWAGKGGGMARIELPGEIGYVDFYNTHAQAGYGNPDYKLVRKEQMTELAQFIQESNGKDVPAFLVGDMNCSEGEDDFRACIEGASLIRVMNVPSSIDHVFARESGSHHFLVLDSQEIRDHEGLRLSDHNGYMTTVRIVPENRSVEN